MELNRDTRCRYLFGKRYDYRQNLIDWDYQMGVKTIAPIVHWYHYRDWRKTGVAFEQGFSRYIVSNKTMGSYMPGKKVAILKLEINKGKLSCARLLGGYYSESLHSDGCRN